jgi:hypothetical protein
MVPQLFKTGDFDMNKFAFAALAAATAFVATPAFAQAAGTVDVTGTVAAKCTAITPISGSITLGELSKSNGTVDPTFAGNTGGLSRSFTVRCTGANPGISVNAKALVNAAVATPASGYANTVHYTATLTAAGSKGTSASAVDTSNASGATVAALGDRLAASNNNVTLAISTGNTTDAAAVLEAGTYAGSVDVIISPAA